MVENQIVVYDAPVWTVYMHVNRINGKKYVGITSQTLQKRWREGNGYHSKNPIGKAIQKYGWDNFDHYTLLSELTGIMAEIMEQVLIVYYNTNIKNNNGYNVQTYGCLKTYSNKKNQNSGLPSLSLPAYLLLP